VTGWLTLLDHADDPADVWPAGTVLILDEATQVSTRDARPAPRLLCEHRHDCRRGRRSRAARLGWRRRLVRPPRRHHPGRADTTGQPAAARPGPGRGPCRPRRPPLPPA
jgi:hypothetical protein